jgi:hypothetical protein
MSVSHCSYDVPGPYDQKGNPHVPVCSVDSKPAFVQPDGKILRRFGSVRDTLKSLATVIKTANAVIKMLKVLDVVAKPLLEVLPFAAIVTYTIGVIPSSLIEVIRSGKRVRTFTVLSKQLHKCTSIEEKATILQNEIESLEAQRKSLQKDLGWSKEAAVALRTRIDRVRELRFCGGETTIDQENAVLEMEDAINILKGRSRVILAYDSFDFVNNIVELVSQILFLTPFAAVGACLGLTSISGSTALSIGKSYFLNRNPFDPDSKSKAIKIVGTMTSGLKRVCQTVDVRRLSQKALPVAVPAYPNFDSTLAKSG